MNTEPVRLVSLINAALIATLAILVGFNVLTGDQAALVGAALSAWVIVVGEVVRGKVTPTGE